MIRLINPQLLFLFNKRGKIENTYFITFMKKVEDTKTYDLFKYIQRTNSNFFENYEYEIINDHVLLTLNLSMARGYIQHMLKIKQKICLFSLWNNIDYSSSNNSVFNPFHLSDDFERSSENLILYEVYKNIATNTIFCVVKEEDLVNKNLCSDGEYKPIVSSFVNDVVNIDLSDTIDIQLSYETLNKSVYNINWDDSILYYINNIDQKKKCINKYYFSSVFLTGDNLCLLEDIDDNKIIKDQTYTSLYVYDSTLDYKKIFFIQNEILHINDLTEFQTITNRIQRIYNLITNEKSFKHNAKIEFENFTFTDTIDINYEIDFFIEHTVNTRNIFNDKAKKISIITATTHISFPSYDLDYELYLYITKIIIGLQISGNKVVFQKVLKKQGERYYSRYCQGRRKPDTLASIEDVDLNNFTKQNDFFYKTKNEKQSGDVFYNKETNKYLICNEDNLKNIGFINEIYQGYNICLACCYKKDKTNTSIFTKCSTDTSENKVSKIFYEPYLHVFKKYRVIMDPSKIGLLLEKVNDFFNPNVKIIYQFDKKNIKESSVNEIIKFLSKERKSDSKSKLMAGSEGYANDVIYNFSSPALEKYTSLVEERKDSKIKDYYNLEISNKLKPLDLENTEQYLLINKLNKIRLAKNYIVYMATNDLTNIKSVNDFLINDIPKPCLIFSENSVYFKPWLVSEYNFNRKEFLDKVEFYLLIQNKIHILKSITNQTFNDELTVSSISMKVKEKIFSQLFDSNPFKFEKKEGILNFDQSSFYFRGEREDNKARTTKYFYNFPRISLFPETIGHYIVEILYKKYFSTIYVEEEKTNLVKKTFLANLLNIIDFDLHINSYFKNDYNKIKPLIKYLNKRFINSKELLKIENA